MVEVVQAKNANQLGLSPGCVEWRTFTTLERYEYGTKMTVPSANQKMLYAARIQRRRSKARYSTPPSSARSCSSNVLQTRINNWQIP